jgi:uncharacterized surface protein with fasciclin (FAS1) repeats
MNRRHALKSAAALGLISAIAPLSALAANHRDIVDVAAANSDFSTLVAAVQAAGLVDTLKGTGPFTVFAPTDAAFAALPAGTVESLLKPENRDMLVNILTYHVVPGIIRAERIIGTRGRIAMVNGGMIHVDGTGDGVHINRTTRVAATDIQASNGLIHVIDSVLLPG